MKKKKKQLRKMSKIRDVRSGWIMLNDAQNQS